ncbi:FecR family protein [Subsaxibacter sp. CAU 1640]|uniref:FecR family protein n=1 Tax=Subsaxibacter sp. CAU 1640 TaxID=2933271 RepID=UPI002003B1BD|nr:FecR family protein [Subsaxibacter sp. CAU 1640]MCK7592008.1 FecR family protein [Subsaxibacter sp. CAU 1640]
MNREDLIYKWLNHELDAQELEAFKQLEDYDALMRLDTCAKDLKAPEYNTSDELKSVLQKINKAKPKRRNWLPAAMSIVAIFVVCFGFYFYTTSLDSTFKTLVAQKEIVELPDGSEVNLNALSELSFNKNNWKDNRKVTLNGEAYFKVVKGSKFKVQTNNGIVSVLGTQFNIKQRAEYFEVICYEGSVKVFFKQKNVILKSGDTFLIRDGKLIATEKEIQPYPSWIDNYSRFKSVPFKEVVAEFERQFDVDINLKSIDDSQLFTGSFTHENMDTAIKSITLPLQLTYSKTNRTIILKRE